MTPESRGERHPRPGLPCPGFPPVERRRYGAPQVSFQDHGKAAWADVYPKGLRGFSTQLAHCSGGPRPRHSSAPPLQPSSSTWPPSRLYAARGKGGVPAMVDGDAAAREREAEEPQPGVRDGLSGGEPRIHGGRAEGIDGGVRGLFGDVMACPCAGVARLASHVFATLPVVVLEYGGGQMEAPGALPCLSGGCCLDTIPGATG